MTDITPTADEGEELRSCPFCGGAVQHRHALFVSDGNTDAIIHAAPAVCGLLDFDIGTADFGVSVAAAWNRRAQAVPAVPQGWKMVPVEPTPEMVEAGWLAYLNGTDDNRGDFATGYRAMLAAVHAAQSDERSTFEAWAISMDYCIDRDETPKYINYHRATTRFAWEAWQARAAIAASRSTASTDEKDTPA